MISHTWKREWWTCQSSSFPLPSPSCSAPAHNREHVYLLVDVDVGGVRRPPSGIPTQKLQLLEHLFDCRERARAQRISLNHPPLTGSS